MLQNLRTFRRTSLRCDYVIRSPFALSNRQRFQLAKQKADELEDFNTGMLTSGIALRLLFDVRLPIDNESEMDVDPGVVEEGTRLVEQLLKTWVARTSAQDGEDVVMVDGDGVDESEAQLAELKRCLEEFRPQLEGNLWVQKVLATLV